MFTYLEIRRSSAMDTVCPVGHRQGGDAGWKEVVDC